MKRKMMAAMLAGVMLLGITGCGKKEAAAPASTEKKSTQSASTEKKTEAEKAAKSERPAVETQEVAPTYQTVTEGYDWGPAISKVIVNFDTALDSASVAAEDFKVSSERKYVGFDFATQKVADIDSVVERAITAAYVSDKDGNKASEGNFVTIEMKVGPTVTEGSPYNYDMATGHNIMVQTDYLISLADGAEILSKDGKSLFFTPTDATGNKGNVNVIADSFDMTGTYTQDNITLTYASYMPATAQAGATPLIIWLHGAGEGGTDPSIAILGNKVVNLATEDVQQYFGATGAAILAPQTPSMWLDAGDGSTYLDPQGTVYRSIYTDALMGLINNYVTANPQIDASRIYIGGCSNGGYMTVNMLIEFPDYFAAAYPVCEAYAVKWLNDEKIAAIKNIPMWITSAKADGVVKIFEGEPKEGGFGTIVPKLDAGGNAIPIDEYSNALYDRLVAAGAPEVYYSLFDDVKDSTGNYKNADGSGPYEYMGHWSWIFTLNNECKQTINGKETTIFEWMAMQKKQ